MRVARALVYWLVLAAASAQAQELDTVTIARELYNQEQYEAAIAAADAARKAGNGAPAASIVLARAHLERYRQTRDNTHLTAAREALRNLNASTLTPADRAEFSIGLAEWLFLHDRFGAAAELFDSALGFETLDLVARDRVLDWWATAIDRHAQVTPTHREALYQRILDRMTEELRRNPASIAAGYWVAAAARGLGDLDRAWNAAVAGWLRARTAPDHGAALRADLDRLVQTAIIPERARELARPAGDPSAAAQGLTAEWERLKEQWN